MTQATAAAPVKRLQRTALLCAIATSAMFAVGWIWFQVSGSLLLGNEVIFTTLTAIATVQLASGVGAVINGFRAHSREGMSVGMLLICVITGAIFGLLGLVGAPFFFMLRHGIGQ